MGVKEVLNWAKVSLENRKKELLKGKEELKREKKKLRKGKYPWENR